MRNSKVKTFKKTALITLSLLLISAGATFADTNWTNFVNQKPTTESGVPASLNLSGNANADSTLNLTTPPVPGYNINGNNNTINGGGATGPNITIISAEGVNTVIQNTNFVNAYNDTGTDTDDGGGAIYNNNGNMVIRSTGATKSLFRGNQAVNGGAVANMGTGSLTIDNIHFQENSVSPKDASGIGYGGAIYNTSTGGVVVRNSLFTNNSAGDVATGAYGGAIYSSAGVLEVSNTEFNGNHAQSEGGAIANRADAIISNAVFDGNYSDKNAGAIVNDGSPLTPAQNANLTITNTIFRNNHAGALGSGGAILNATSLTADPSEGTPETTHTVTINQGTQFINNYVVDTDGSTISGSGGAILNGGANNAYHKDGVLIINGGASTSTQVLFKNNIANVGGAITNRGIATVNNAVFDTNGISPDNTSLNTGSMTARGGAIYNEKYMRGSDSNIRISNSTFLNNRASANGGAIYNASKATIIDSDFSGNAAGNTGGSPSLENGGAIYTVTATNSPDSRTTIIAQNKDVNIGNASSYADKTDSIVFQGIDSNVATGDFLARDGKNLNIHSLVRGSSTDTTTINFGDNSGNYNGNVNFLGDARLTSSTVNIYSGMVSFAHDSSFDQTNILNMYGGTLNLMNGEYGPHQLKAQEFNLLGDASVRLDVDLANLRMDGIYEGTDPKTGETYIGRVTNPGGNTLTIDEMYARTDAKGSDAEVLFTNAPALMDGKVAYNEGKLVQSPTTKYAVTQTQHRGEEGYEDGVYFGFRKLGASDPAISGPVAAQAAYIMMDNLYRQSFANMDFVALMTPEQRELLRVNNRLQDKRAKGYVTGVYAPNTVPEERDGLYVRPFANFENVPLKNGPKVSNVFYGTLIGGESDLIDLGHGWDGTFSFFGAYHGSHQAYNGVDIWQNGGTLGAVGTVYKGRFFSGLTANVGAAAAEARHGFGNDQFPIFMTGAAWKSGYNFGLAKNRFIIQPSYMMSYTFVNVFDYTSASGARITQDPLNAIEIIPGLRLIGNFKNGWQPYLGANMTWNIMDKAKFYANEAALPQLSVKPFFEYGFGVQKRYGDRFTGFGQCFFRNGGRNGVALTLGMRWALGN